MGAPVALVDCNNFYASCERLFQPALRGRAVVVLSNNDGCVIARSNEAKVLGVAMGEPWHVLREKHPFADLAVRSSNYTLYGDISARVMRVLRDFTPMLEIYSIDEAFLDLNGFEGDLEAHARRLRARVLQWTGIPVSVGIGPTKTLAKAANRTAKKDAASEGVCLLLTGEAQSAALAHLELTDLWGVADRLAARLKDVGIETPLQLRDADARFIRERFSVVLERTVLELRGTPCLGLDQDMPDRKSVMSSRSFGQPVMKLEDLRAAIAGHVGRAAEKMRRQNLATTGVAVFLQTNRFRPDLPQYSPMQTLRLPVATADTARILSAATEVLERIYRPAFRYVKAGVIFPELVLPGAVQGGLWTAPDTDRRERLMVTMDGLNQRFGRGALMFGACNASTPWQLRTGFASPHYTTDWADLLRVG